MKKRNPYAVPAKERQGGPMKERGEKRQSGRNERRDFLEEYETLREEQDELDTQVEQEDEGPGEPRKNGEED